MPDAASQLAGDLLGLYAQTSLHSGTGAALSAIDLPIQRERHTDWPTIAGSALKGILRDMCRDKLHALSNGSTRKEVDEDDSNALTAVFGPGDINKTSSYSGAFSPTDARLLLMPVRSALDVFAYVTCRGALERLTRDATLAEVPTNLGNLPDLGDEEIVVATGTKLDIPWKDERNVLLEEHAFKVQAAHNCDIVAKWIADNLLPEANFSVSADRLKRSLVIVSDSSFTYFVKYATEVNARIALNPETKTVEEGALFYQEFLPSEALLYSVLLADRPRRKQVDMQDAHGVLKFVADNLRPIIQIGGDATTGKGLCATRLAKSNRLNGGAQ